MDATLFALLTKRIYKMKYKMTENSGKKCVGGFSSNL